MLTRPMGQQVVLKSIKSSAKCMVEGDVDGHGLRPQPYQVSAFAMNQNQNVFVMCPVLG